MRRSTLQFLSGCILVTFFSPAATSQERWSWPDKPENLQVLPKDWNGSRLRPVMLGFVNALGVGCSHCHVGTPGQPLSTYDFASDKNPNKERAREMYRMLGDINTHLKNITPSGDKPVNMWCHTCHSGRPRPMTLEEELGEAHRTAGLDSALARYAALKNKFYGKGAYNFEDEGTLNAFGYEILKQDATAALRVFRMNAEKFPESANAWDSLAEAYMKAGDKANAEKYYKKSLELNPKNQNARDMLKQLKE